MYFTYGQSFCFFCKYKNQTHQNVLMERLPINNILTHLAYGLYLQKKYIVFDF